MQATPEEAAQEEKRKRKREEGVEWVDISVFVPHPIPGGVLQSSLIPVCVSTSMTLENLSVQLKQIIQLSENSLHPQLLCVDPSLRSFKVVWSSDPFTETLGDLCHTLSTPAIFTMLSLHSISTRKLQELYISATSATPHTSLPLDRTDRTERTTSSSNLKFVLSSTNTKAAQSTKSAKNVKSPKTHASNASKTREEREERKEREEDDPIHSGSEPEDQPISEQI